MILHVFHRQAFQLYTGRRIKHSLLSMSCWHYHLKLNVVLFWEAFAPSQTSKPLPELKDGKHLC